MAENNRLQIEKIEAWEEFNKFKLNRTEAGLVAQLAKAKEDVAYFRDMKAKLDTSLFVYRFLIAHTCR